MSLPQARAYEVLAKSPPPLPLLVVAPIHGLPDWGVRIPALDGLRGVAILMVLLRHSIFGMETNSRILSPLLATGRLAWSGVDLFFVLSGFLIGGILLDAKESPQYFKTFYIRRAYRIFPLYYLVTIIFLFRHLPFHLLPGTLGNYSSLSIPWAAYLTLTQNFWMVHLGWFGLTAMAPTWSLAVEEQFYLTIPLLIRILSRRWLIVCLGCITIAAPLLRILLQYRFPASAFGSFVLMPCRADALCLGVFSALCVRSPRIWRFLRTRRKYVRVTVGILFAGFVFMSWSGYEQFSPPMNTVGYSWLAVFYSCCLLAIVSGTSGITQKLLQSSLLMRLGTISYCAYLIHLPLILAGRRLVAIGFSITDHASWLPGGMLGLAATMVIASLSWSYLEKPLLRRGHRFSFR